MSTTPQAQPRRPSLRDRRGRGMRGPAVWPPIPAAPAPIRQRQQPRPRFDRIALRMVAEIDARWQQQLGLVEYAVEDTPVIPDDWESDTVPLSSLIRGQAGRPTRLVLFRRPIEQRAEGPAELEALVLTVVVEQVAELLGLRPDEVDPRYDPGP